VQSLILIAFLFIGLPIDGKFKTTTLLNLLSNARIVFLVRSLPSLVTSMQWLAGISNFKVSTRGKYFKPISFLVTP